jgi:hypothetical protein
MSDFIKPATTALSYEEELTTIENRRAFLVKELEYLERKEAKLRAKYDIQKPATAYSELETKYLGQKIDEISDYSGEKTYSSSRSYDKNRPSRTRSDFNRDNDRPRRFSSNHSSRPNRFSQDSNDRPRRYNENKDRQYKDKESSDVIKSNVRFRGREDRPRPRRDYHKDSDNKEKYMAGSKKTFKPSGSKSHARPSSSASSRNFKTQKNIRRTQNRG